MHDDQHGTSIISAAGLLNALEMQGKDIHNIKLVVNGAGAAAVSCTKLYIALGVRPENVVMCDSKGVITKKRGHLTPQKEQFATDRDITTLAEAMVGADVFPWTCFPCRSRTCLTVAIKSNAVSRLPGNPS